MDEFKDEQPRPVNPRRRRRSKVQIFKETYLPAVIAGVALILVIVFIIGAISRGAKKRKIEAQEQQSASESMAQYKAEQDRIVNDLLTRSAQKAAEYDYLGAIDLLNSYTGSQEDYPQIAEKINQYSALQNELQAWDDPNKVESLSFQILIADPSRAFTHSGYGSSFNRNYITTGEFSKILQSLYDNDYILVRMSDFITTTTNEAGQTVYSAKTMYLPKGKKPLMITQTNVNYSLYIVDGDDDGVPDKDGGGFANKLVLDSNGKVVAEMVDKNGKSVTGAYDLVPILDAFVEQHPDFSYRGAKATLAVSGSNGLLGYRTTEKDKQDDGEAVYNQAVTDAKAVVNALLSSGYEFACYTYDNVAYGEYTTAQIKDDLNQWIKEVSPLIGKTEKFVFALESELTNFSGDEFKVLENAGFRYFSGFSDNGDPWVTVAGGYVRQARVLVTGYNMAYNANWFVGLFDAKAILDPSRGDVPQY